MQKVYKVTSAKISKTKKGYKILELLLNNSIVATKLLPLKQRDKKYDTFYQMYIKNQGVDFLVRKFISAWLTMSKYGYQIENIHSLDVIQDFTRELEESNGNSFFTKLPIYDFLFDMNREVQSDSSIKIISSFGDMRVVNTNGYNICYPYGDSLEKLTLQNIFIIFDKFYKDVMVENSSRECHSSYYEIQLNKVGIVRMDHRVKVSYRATTKDDYNYWEPTVVQKLGRPLQKEQIEYLKTC